MNAPLRQPSLQDNIVLELGGAIVSIPPRLLAKAMLERVLAGSVHGSVGLPNIGEKWDTQGGVYAGVIRGVPDQHVIVASVDVTEIAWQPALDWARHLNLGGFSDWSLPTRKEQALLFANVPELFKAEYYWSSEQHAEVSDYAWMQGFFNGIQDYDGKGGKYRARAVRRVPIQ